jgi:hypothetical protein
MAEGKPFDMGEEFSGIDFSSKRLEKRRGRIQQSYGHRRQDGVFHEQRSNMDAG